jgi:hypothetical protein
VTHDERSKDFTCYVATDLAFARLPDLLADTIVESSDLDFTCKRQDRHCAEVCATGTKEETNVISSYMKNNKDTSLEVGCYRISEITVMTRHPCTERESPSKGYNRGYNNHMNHMSDKLFLEHHTVYGHCHVLLYGKYIYRCPFGLRARVACALLAPRLTVIHTQMVLVTHYSLNL